MFFDINPSPSRPDDFFCTDAGNAAGHHRAAASLFLIMLYVNLYCDRLWTEETQSSAPTAAPVAC
jgi:hypothetical protein